jgi:hypothetical protein
MKTKTRLAVRNQARGPNRGLWLNNGTWCVDFTIHLHDYKKGRIRASLRTKTKTEALARRDVLLHELPRYFETNRQAGPLEVKRFVKQLCCSPQEQRSRGGFYAPPPART